jgi:hypothetical protein
VNKPDHLQINRDNLERMYAERAHSHKVEIEGARMKVMLPADLRAIKVQQMAPAAIRLPII